MNHSPADIIAQFLIGEGLLSDPEDSSEWKVYVGKLPNGRGIDDDIAAVIDTSPIKDGRIMGGESVFHYGIQILVRAEDYNTGYAKASELVSALEEVDDEAVIVNSVDAYELNAIGSTTGVVNLGQDEESESRLELFSANFLATLKEV